jgi:hypothetical protein
LDSIFFVSRAWIPPLFIGGGRGTFCLYWCQIFALDLIWNDLNCWFKVVIMNCQNWMLKVSRVGNFRAGPR